MHYAPPKPSRKRRRRRRKSNKVLMNPGVVEIIIRGKGAFEKFVENRAAVNEYYRSVTVRRKTEKAGVTVDVLGDVVYRLLGGRWVFRKMHDPIR